MKVEALNGGQEKTEFVIYWIKSAMDFEGEAVVKYWERRIHRAKRPKRGYSIRESIAQNVDLLVWYRDRSSSSIIVDEALMEYLERCKAKAQLKSARKL